MSPKGTNKFVSSPEALKVEQLVLDYQNSTGDKKQEIATILLENFSAYLNKFITLIKYRKINWLDKEHKRFLALFIPDKKLTKDIRRYRPTKEARIAGYEVLAGLNYTVQWLTDDDLYHELVVLFFEHVSRYKQKGRNFVAYLTSSLYKMLYNRLVRKIIVDPMSYWYIRLDNDQPPGYNENFIDFVDQLYMIESIESDIDTLNLDWERGINTGYIFEELSQYERMLLREFYVERRTSYEVAAKLGLAAITVKRHKALVLNKVRTKCLEYHLIRLDNGSI